MAQLPERIRASEGQSLLEDSGVLRQLARVFIESAAEGELDADLGYAKRDAAGRSGENSRNWHRPEDVADRGGDVEVDMPRDREGSFEPQIVRKRKRRLDGIDEIVRALCD